MFSFVDFQNFQKSNLDGGKFLKIQLSTFPGITRGYTTNLDPIGSAVLTFIGYKRTDKQTDKPNLYIDGTGDHPAI